MSNGRPSLGRKELEKVTGFLNHLAMTFDDMNPFLKGLYLTLNSWRPNRDDEDWKVTDKKWKRILLDRLERGEISNDEFDGKWTEDPGAPVLVTASPRMCTDVHALLSIMEPLVVPRVSIRSKTILSVVYGFGDASGTGLGATFTCGSGFNYRIGVWGTSEESESSNWKEFTNVVDSLEEETEEGNLGDAEVFMFTDNATVEACSQKGSSSSPKLLSLIIRLRSMATRHNVKINMFHVAGTRMIAQGTDGVSRGYLGLGVMAGDSMSLFIPNHLSAPERSSAIVPWVRGWTSSGAILLEPIGWLGERHDISGWETSEDGFKRPSLSEGRTYIWAPPPFAADVALAELRKARIKRQSSAHVFICPRLCAPLWLKQLYKKAADIVFEVPPGKAGWPANMHEPLLIGLLFPFLRHSNPWQLRGTPKMHAVGGQLRRLYEKEDMDPRDFLREFWARCLRLGHVYEAVVRRVLYFRPLPSFHIADDDDRMSSGWPSRASDSTDYRRGRNGDDLLISFECDVCIFGKLYKARPRLHDPKDIYIMACIRRICLDAFWSRASSTVAGNANQIRQGMRHSESIGLSGPYYPPGPLPPTTIAATRWRYRWCCPLWKRGLTALPTNNGTPSGSRGRPTQIK